MHFDELVHTLALVVEGLSLLNYPFLGERTELGNPQKVLLQ